MNGAFSMPPGPPGGNWTHVPGTYVQNRTNILYVNSTYWTILADNISARMASSADGVTWSAGYGLGIPVGGGSTTNGSAKMLAYDGTRFVVAYQQKVAYSFDGVSWTIVDITPLIGSQGIRCLIYAGGQFVMVGTAGTVFTFTDPAGTITARTSGTANDLYGITYSGTRYVAVGSGNTFVYSNDAITWSLTASMGVTSWRDITYGNGKFCAVNANGRIAYSTDGATFTVIIFGSSGYSIDFGAGVFVKGYTNAYAYSSDAITWTNASNTFPNSISFVAIQVSFANSKFLTVAQASTAGTYLTLCHSSGTGTTFAEAAVHPRTFVSLSYVNSKWVLSGMWGAIAYSNDLSSWTYSPTGTGSSAFTSAQVAFGSSRYVTCDGSSTYSSTDLQTWSFNSTSVSIPQAIRFLNSFFYVVGSGGTISRSATGADSSWTQQTTGLVSQIVVDITASGTAYVAVCSGGAILYSPNGSTWSIASSNTTTLTSVTYGNGLFVAVGSSGLVMTSPDGQTWTTQPTVSGGTILLQEVVFCSNTFYAYSHDQSVLPALWRSRDGVSWLPTNVGNGGMSPSSKALCTDGNRLIAITTSGPAEFI